MRRLWSEIRRDVRIEPELRDQLAPQHHGVEGDEVLRCDPAGDVFDVRLVVVGAANVEGEIDVGPAGGEAQS
jgi:hypothetical protein